MKFNMLKVFLIAILAVAVILPFSKADTTQAASTKTAYVDVSSGSLTVRSGPGANYKKVGSLKNGVKTTVYSQTKTGWSEIRYNKRKAYVSTKYLRFYYNMSQSTAKSITDRVINMQRKTWERNYTKQQIYSIMNPGFTTTYIDKFFKEQMYKSGKDRYGNQLYHQIETEIFGYNIDNFEWYAKKKPTIQYYIKDNQEYLVVSQYLLDEESGNHWTYLYLSKANSKSTWKVYDISRKYD
ncbi:MULTISPECIES: SH3 domain-containing protein [Priestia]|uniref:SH3 domain-containing protein n=1 Tax=Priestia TaxID=2800373 RepID=UPI001C8D31E6|nr:MULTISPECIES: SH3 domain-containing protein [Priestia]MBX9999310.1 SH3 domain-containing protein [Priestia aryabhattai]MDG0059630.1 SH3 domain-containing protein [Priestia sp. P5]